MTSENEYYVVCAIERKQRRDEKGKFLKKRIRYMKNGCPKASFCDSLDDAKLFKTLPKATYSLNGISKEMNCKYYMEITKVTKKIEIK